MALGVVSHYNDSTEKGGGQGDSKIKVTYSYMQWHSSIILKNYSNRKGSDIMNILKYIHYLTKTEHRGREGKSRMSLLTDTSKSNGTLSFIKKSLYHGKGTNITC